MDVLTRDELEALAQPREGWCISLYMPTVEKSEQTRQNAIRYKNLVDQAEEKLREAGLDKKAIHQLLDQGGDLAGDRTFWQTQDKSLAVFIARDFFQTYSLPIHVEEQAVVNDRFFLKPLLPLLYGGHQFFILALSLNEVRMFRADEYHVEEIQPPGLPPSMQEALGYDTFETHVQWQTSITGPSGHLGHDRAATFHGHGEGDDNRKAEILNFLRFVDKAVTGYLQDNRAPLVLAAVEYLVPLYREANTYRHLAADHVAGSPDGVEPRELHKKAWQRIQHAFKDNKEDVAGQYKLLSGWEDKRAVKDVEEIIKAAPYGRVEVLFVDKNAKRWGTFDEANVEVKFEDEQRPGNQDLLDYAAVQTLLHGGTVFAVEPEDLPEGGSPAAAILRY